MTERGNLLSRQKCLWIVMTLLAKIFYCNNIENELKSYHNKTNRANFVWMQDFWMLLETDSTSWQKTLQNSHNSQMQWPVVSTLCQERKIHLNQKVGSEETPKLDQYWKLQLVTCTVSTELKSGLCLWTKDSSHPWVRISHGLNKLVTNLNNKEQDDNEQETSEMQFEDYALKTNARAFASRSKAQAKPQRRTSASSSTKTFDVEPGKCSHSDYPVSNKLIYLLRHGSLPRDNDGVIEFWRKDYLQDHFVFCHHWPDEEWKSSMAGGGHKKRFQYCADFSGTMLYLRTLQGHSGRNLIESSLQDNVVIPDGFFKYMYRVGCAINLHSIINSGLIPGGQHSSNRQTVFFLPVYPMDKEHTDPEKVDLKAPRLAQYMHKALKRHQNTVYWVDINIAQKKALKFHQTRSNAIILHETLPAHCIPKVVRIETGEVMYETVYASPRPPPKISLKHDWMKELGSEGAQRPDGQVVQQFQKFPIKPTNSKPRSW